MKKLLGILCVLLLSSVAFIGCSGADSKTTTDNNKQSQSETKSTAGLISLEQYNKITEGMTYEEVRDIIGSEGTLASEVGSKGDIAYSVTYNWTGTEIASFATLTFTNEKLQLKFQAGLK